MPLDVLIDEAPADAVPLTPVVMADPGDEAAVPAFARAAGFTGAAGTVCPVPDAAGTVAGFLVGLGDGSDPLAFGAAPAKLPAGAYVIEPAPAPDQAGRLALAWALGAYRFDRYRPADGEAPRLAWPAGANRGEVSRTVRAVELVRDLVNTPAADMGPAELEAAARDLAAAHGAEVDVIVGEALQQRNYPAIHAVGRASSRAPRLIDLRWGAADAPKVTLVGKGVCFDSGGLDLKPASAMKLMKKDMGGAAHALGLASMIMAAGLPVRLRVLIPAVDNAVSGDSFRPGDVLRTRKGLTVEVNNTDAEGRLVLADALAEADAEAPEVLIDFATLTGAARVALGPDLPALMSNDEALAEAILAAGVAERDEVWRLPLWRGYRGMVESRVADLDNAPEGGMAGAITAGLFLEHFVSEAGAWAHLDVYAWNPKARPARPVGAAAQGIRAVFAVLQGRYGG